MYTIANTRRAHRNHRAAAQVNLTQRRQWFDEQGTPQPPVETPVAPPAQNGDADSGQTFTQADLNRILSDRLKRAKDGATKDLLEALGVDSLDVLKTTLTTAQAKAESEKSEVQKALEKAEAAEKRAAEMEARATKAEQDRLLDVRNTAIKEAFKDARTNKPGSVLTLMLADHPALVEAVLKDGEINKDALAKLTEAAKKEHAELFVGSGPGSPSNYNGNVPQPNKEAKEQARQNQSERLRKRF